MEALTTTEYERLALGGVAVEQRDLWEIVRDNLVRMFEESEYSTAKAMAESMGISPARWSQYTGKASQDTLSKLVELQRMVEAHGRDPRDLFVTEDSAALRKLPAHLRPAVVRMIEDLASASAMDLRLMHMRERLGDETFGEILDAVLAYGRFRDIASSD